MPSAEGMLPDRLVFRLNAEQWQAFQEALDAPPRVTPRFARAGLRAILVHAKDDSARKFYEHFEFVPPPTDACHLMRLLKDARAMLVG